MDMKKQVAYVVRKEDLVATALDSLSPGAVELRGGVTGLSSVSENIPFGHKFALRDIVAGEKIIKYGVPIAIAAEDILQGAYVHTHNAKSMLDMKSNRWEGSE